MEILKFIKPSTLTFVSKSQFAGDVYSFTFTPERELSWRAGQHAMLELKLPNGRTGRRMFSLSSAPSEGQITVTTHWRGELASDYKKSLWSLRAGDKARLRGRVGPMYLRDDQSEYVFLAGGIGITPFYAILKEAAANSTDLKATLLYVNKDETKSAFRNELDDLLLKLDQVSINYILSPDTLTEQDIRNASQDITKTMYYLSGPPKMVRKYKKMLRSMGIAGRKIKTDPFLGY